jgi:hypothetical protein
MAVREVSIYTSRAEKKGDIGGGEGMENEEGEERRKEKKKRETHVDRVRMVLGEGGISHLAHRKRDGAAIHFEWSGPERAGRTCLNCDQGGVEQCLLRSQRMKEK